MLNSKKIWVFDLDGMLIDSFPFYLNILRRILNHFGQTLLDDEIQECLGQPAQKFLAKKIGSDLVPSAMVMLRDQGLADASLVKSFDGVSEVLEHLKTQGARLAIFTSRDLTSAKLVLENVGLSRYFDYFVSGCCVAEHKPSPVGLLRIASHFDCALSDIVVVGDHDVDMQASAKAGCYGLRASWHAFNPALECSLAQEVFLTVSGLQARLQVHSSAF